MKRQLTPPVPAGRSEAPAGPSPGGGRGLGDRAPAKTRPSGTQPDQHWHLGHLSNMTYIRDQARRAPVPTRPHPSRPPSKIRAAPPKLSPPSSASLRPGCTAVIPGGPRGHVAMCSGLRAHRPPPSWSAPYHKGFSKSSDRGITRGSHLSSYRLRCASLRTGRSWGGAEAWRGGAVHPALSPPSPRQASQPPRPNRAPPDATLLVLFLL